MSRHWGQGNGIDKLRIIATTIVLLVVILLDACDGSSKMNTLDTSKYFSDPNVASFVDAVQRGDVGRVKAGLAAGIDPNAHGLKGFRPIHFVFFATQPDVLKLLLAAGANPNALLENGDPPLHFSVRNQNPEFTRLLLAAGADPNARGENGKPNIHEAIFQEGAATQVNLLHSAGADLNVTWGGGTPVMRALGLGKWQVAKTLIDLGADLNAKDPFGQTALERACDFINKIPVNDENKKGISAVTESLKRRNLVLPCKTETDRFH